GTLASRPSDLVGSAGQPGGADEQSSRRMLTDRPRAALAMVPGVEAELLTVATRSALESMVELVAPTAVDLDRLADDVLGRIEVVLGSWGCNVLDDALLARMPKLRFLAFA